MDMQTREQLNSVKPGYKTTEFWFSVLGMGVTIAGAFFGAPVAAIGAAALGVGYQLTRGYTKVKSGDMSGAVAAAQEAAAQAKVARDAIAALKAPKP